MDGDWENVDSGQDQSMLRWIMGDVEDPSIILNKMLLAPTSDDAPVDFNGGFCANHQDSGNPVDQIGNLSSPEMFNNHQTHHQNQIFSPLNDTQLLQFDIKPNLFNTQIVIPPQPKRYNPGSIEYNPSMHNNPFQLLQKSPSMKKIRDITITINHHQGIIDQLFKAANLIQSDNNPILAQVILARLNHQLSPAGKPFERAAFYFKQSLQLLTHSILNNIKNPQFSPNCSPFSLIFKIATFKSFSEISPYLQFTNFTCNQAILESLNGFDRIHIIDFDIGFGGQWASLIQELGLRTNGVSYIKITAFASPSMQDQLELGLTRENLTHFASELKFGFGFDFDFDFEIVNVDVLSSCSWSWSWSCSLPLNLSDHEAVVVNLPIHVFSNHQTQISSVLRFVKSLNPKIVVSVDRGCDRTDLPFSDHVIHALNTYSNLLESMDAVNTNVDSLQKIEQFLVQPAIEKMVLGRFSSLEKTPHWRDLFLSNGFSPLLFSDFAESQAECLVKRAPVHEFGVEKRQSRLVLCWQRRVLVSVSAWKC